MEKDKLHLIHLIDSDNAHNLVILTEPFEMYITKNNYEENILLNAVIVQNKEEFCHESFYFEDVSECDGPIKIEFNWGDIISDYKFIKTIENKRILDYIRSQKQMGIVVNHKIEFNEKSEPENDFTKMMVEEGVVRYEENENEEFAHWKLGNILDKQ